MPTASTIPVQSGEASFQEIPLFFGPSAPPPALPILLAQTEIGNMRSSDKLLGQEELATSFARRREHSKARSAVRFSPYPSSSKKTNAVDSTSSLSDLSSLSDSDSDDDDLISKPKGEAGRPGRGGYNLEEALDWPGNEYRRLKVGLCLECLPCLTCSNRNISRNLLTSTLSRTRTFAHNLPLLLPLLKL